MEFFLRAYRQGAAIALAPNAIIYHIVSDERLAPEMLLGAATRGGLVRAEVELAVFRVPIPLLCSLVRAARLILWTLPQMLVQKLAPAGASRVLGTRCAARFSLSYCNAVRQHILSIWV